MNEQIEIEYKVLLTKEIYNSILNDYRDLSMSDYKQTNYYFTHPLIQKNKYMLRIREKNNQYELTLKRPQGNHRLELNINISKEDKDKLINHIPIDNEIIECLKTLGINQEELKQQFSLTTHRYDIVLKEGTLSLDYNTYQNNEDYELEFEVEDELVGYQKFLEIIKPYHIHYQKNCDSKIKRVLDSL